MLYHVSDNIFKYNCVINPLDAAGFQETGGSDYNLLWGGYKSPEFLREFGEH
jgi:hypothetical protein